MRLLISISLFAAAAAAQSSPAFEVASVRPATSLTPQQRRAVRPIRFNVDVSQVDIAGSSLKYLVEFAFDVKDYQVSGPVWMADEKFDIQAKPPAGATRAQLPAMMVRLLMERFHLAFHREIQRSDVYALVVGKNGLKLKALPADTPVGLKPTLSPNGIVRIELTNTFDGLAAFLTLNVSRPVVDFTETPGIYQMPLNLSTDEVMEANAGAAPFLFAVEEFGLKLEPRSLPIEIIVLDQVDRAPTEN